MSELKNYYEVLEVPSNAKYEEIYQSYLRAKTAYSNDSLALYSLMSQDECRNVLELVEEAYSILSDPNKRKRYDEARGINREFNLQNYNTLSDRVDPIRNSFEERRAEAHAFHASTSSSSSSSLESSHLFSQKNQDFKINNIKDSAPLPSSNLSMGNSNVSKLVTQKRFALDFVASTDFEKEIEEATEFNGEFLRKIREYKNVDLDRLADMTKVSRGHLQNIELEDFSKLPAHVYVRGFVFQYAKCLKLKPDLVANSYINRMKKLKP